MAEASGSINVPDVAQREAAGTQGSDLKDPKGEKELLAYNGVDALA
ncbi:hypothetical protein KIH24_08020 [Rhizobiales bacterium TNE-4]|nr:hypothetical protein [Rhizobiales bacterium TNE-4]MBV1827570.1 hypothetical protein [Rhizobiales bacterium TNE-4]